MSKAILGRKLGMTQIFTEEGQVVPVTVIESGNNVVIQSKTVESDGYNAVQLGFGEIKEKHLTKPLKGRFDKAGVDPVKFIREMRLAAPSEYKVGDKIGVDIFEAGQLVDVTGVSKGKGFAGTVKRHGFARGPMGHGSKSHRDMGHERVTVQRLTLVKVDADRNLLLIKGAVPGPKKGLLIIKETVKPNK